MSCLSVNLCQGAALLLTLACAAGAQEVGVGVPAPPAATPGPVVTPEAPAVPAAAAPTLPTLLERLPPGEVGVVQGLSVYVLPVPNSYDLELYGAPLPVVAATHDLAGQVELQHSAWLGGDTRRGFAVVQRFLSSDAAQVPGLAAALARHGADVGFVDSTLPVDGNSASLALGLALTSALLDVPVRQDLAITGALAPDGAARPVAGVIGKLDVLLKQRLRMVVLPLGNLADVGPDNPILARIQVVGVVSFNDAVTMGFGDQGPFAARYRAWAEAWQKAHEALEQGDFETARAALRRCLFEQPGDLSAQFWLRIMGRESPDAVQRLARAAALRNAGQYATAERMAAQHQRDPDDLLGCFAAQCRRERLMVAQELLLRNLRDAFTDGDLGQAALLLAQLEGTLAQCPAGKFSARLARAELTLLQARQAAGKRPTQPAELALAAAAEEFGAWNEAAEALRRARALGPDSPALACREARAQLRLEQREAAADTLFQALWRWPAHEPARDMLRFCGLDAQPPRVVLQLPAGTLSGEAAVYVTTDEPATVTLLVDGRRLTSGPAPLLVTWDTARTSAGPHVVTAVAADAAGNLGQEARFVAVERPGERPPAVMAAAPAAVPGAPAYDVHAVVPGVWQLRRGDRLVVRPADALSAVAAAVDAAPDELAAGLAEEPDRAASGEGSLRVEVTDWSRSYVPLRLHGQYRAGRSVAAQDIRLERCGEVQAWLANLHPGALVSRPTTLDLAGVAAVEATHAWLLVDGRVRGLFPPQRVVLQPGMLLPGGHAVAVAVRRRSGVMCQTPPVMVAGDAATTVAAAPGLAAR